MSAKHQMAGLSMTSQGFATLSNLDMQQCPKIFCNFVQKVLAKNIPEEKNNLEQDILLSVLIQGSFQAFSSHSHDDTGKVTAILGNIADCLVKKYTPLGL